MIIEPSRLEDRRESTFHRGFLGKADATKTLGDRHLGTLSSPKPSLLSELRVEPAGQQQTSQQALQHNHFVADSQSSLGTP